eukprot:scaffold8049_cov286-Pinguiococcus_pyrenoidosus.AAC.8
MERFATQEILFRPIPHKHHLQDGFPVDDEAELSSEHAQLAIVASGVAHGLITEKDCDREPSSQL